MVPSQGLFDAMLSLLAADAVTLAPLLASDNKMKLVTADFLPSRARVIADFTLAAWTGSTPINVVAGTQQIGYDTAVAKWFIEVIPPAGGWYWECTVAPVAPINNYGVILTNHAGTTLWGSHKFVAPVRVENVSDVVSQGPIRFYESDLLTS